ncbi:hypothetical protein BSKO_01744 [Bryopsis sp. KO-2023]|nr:hypothetical protein BSKO_01744 [Bryopsis sp. KO-2023]
MQGSCVSLGRGVPERSHFCSFGWKRSHVGWDASTSHRCCGGCTSPTLTRKRRRTNFRTLSAPDAAVSKDRPVQRMDEVGELRIHSLHEDCQEKTAISSSSSSFQSGRQKCCPSEIQTGCPVYVMLPLDTVRVVHADGRAELKKEHELVKALQKFKSAGVSGIMVDVWWGIVERKRPGQYDLTAYRRLFDLVASADLKIQAVMSFHAAGGNVGDTCEVPLPEWILEIGEDNPDIFYTDRQGLRNRECLSLGCDEEPLFWGRTPVEMYKDFVEEFVTEFRDLCGNVITEITVGLGPAGELRYPSYPEGDGRWCFPGVGEFQCYDKYMMTKLREAAIGAGEPDWGLSGPHDAGHYNSKCWETEFFNCHWGTFDTPYGHFFLSWYSGMLIQHAERVLSAVSEVLRKRGQPRFCKCMTMVGLAASPGAWVSRFWDATAMSLSQCWARVHNQYADGSVLYKFEPTLKLGVKCAGVHWWFKTRAHAAELTAGYYNTRDRDGYGPIMDVLKKHNAHMSFTCVEMRDCEHPPESKCSPQGLLQQIIDASLAKRVPIAGENALQRYDEYAFSRIAESAFGHTARSGRLEQITFLRMGGLMFDNWSAFSSFLERMRRLPSSVDSSP